MPELRSLIAELERVTGELRAPAGDEYSALTEPMRRRSEIILKLTRRLETTGEELDEECRDRLRRQRQAGLELLRKMRLNRAAIQSEFACLVADAQLLQALPRSHASGAVLDCDG